MIELTDKQQETYDWLLGYWRSHGQAPTLREIQVGIGLRSPAPVQQRLKQLREKGWVSWVDGEVRTLKPLNTECQVVMLSEEVAIALQSFKAQCDEHGFDFNVELKAALGQEAIA